MDGHIRFWAIRDHGETGGYFRGEVYRLIWPGA
jgi:hypothetical protein